MEQVIKSTVLGIRRGSVDGNQYASIYILENADPDDVNSKGKMPLKMTCSHALLDRVNGNDLPGDFEIKVMMVPAAGGKVGMKAVDLVPLKPAKQGQAA